MLTREPCNNCGSTTYSNWKKFYPEEDTGREPYEQCNNCSSLFRPKLYDDIYKGDCNKGLTTDPNLCDPDTGKEIPYSSPAEKAAIMKRLNVVQAPSSERNHGSRNEVTRRTYYT